MPDTAAEVPAGSPRLRTPHLHVFPSLRPLADQPHSQDPSGLRLALNENVLGYSPAAAEAAHREIEFGNLYPHSGTEPLRSNLSNYWKVKTEQILVTNGADEVLLLAALAANRNGRYGVHIARTFSGHRTALMIAGQSPIAVPIEETGSIRLDRFVQVLERNRPSIAVIPNPHNPCGTALNADAISILVCAARASGTLLVIDEAYAEYASNRSYGTAIEHIRGGNVVVARTFSKAYGLAGFRVGYAIGGLAEIERMAAIRSVLPFNVNRVALAAADAALKDAGHLQSVIRANAEARDELVRRLAEIGIPVLSSSTNFVLAHIGPPAPLVTSILCTQFGIIVRDATELGWRGWLRIGVPSKVDVERVVSAIASIDTETLAPASSNIRS